MEFDMSMCCNMVWAHFGGPEPHLNGYSQTYDCGWGGWNITTTGSSTSDRIVICSDETLKRLEFSILGRQKYVQASLDAGVHLNVENSQHMQQILNTECSADGILGELAEQRRKRLELLRVWKTIIAESPPPPYVESRDEVYYARGRMREANEGISAVFLSNESLQQKHSKLVRLIEGYILLSNDLLAKQIGKLRPQTRGEAILKCLCGHHAMGEAPPHWPDVSAMNPMMLTEEWNTQELQRVNCIAYQLREDARQEVAAWQAGVDIQMNNLEAELQRQAAQAAEFHRKAIEQRREQQELARAQSRQAADSHRTIHRKDVRIGPALEAILLAGGLTEAEIRALRSIAPNVRPGQTDEAWDQDLPAMLPALFSTWSDIVQRGDNGGLRDSAQDQRKLGIIVKAAMAMGVSLV